MKLSKKAETEVTKVYNAYWDSYLKGDMKTMASCLADDFKVIGSSENEVFFNKKEAMRFYKATADQIAGKAEIRNRNVKVELINDLVLFTEQSDFYILIESEWTFYSKGRISSFLQRKKEDWKFIHQHGSMPDAKAQEGEQVAIEKISKENLELRDAVKRRTIELEHKNHELEIEASLERVRAVALSMKRPDELTGICQILFSELRSLGFRELRNAMINIHNDETGSFLNYDYSDAAVPTVTTIFYNGHPATESLVKQIKKSNDAFGEFVIKGKELDVWRAYRKGMGEQDDPKLDTTSELCYYFYSIGIGAIGISTYSSITEQKLNVLKRYRNVFAFAYRRYMDVAQAEAQAREAKIEAAIEKVRARAMAMQKPGELIEVAQLLRKEMGLLGVEELETSSIYIHNEETGFTECWYAIKDEKKSVSDHMIIDLNDTWVGRQMLQFYRSGKKQISIVMKGMERKEWINYCADHSKVLVGFYGDPIPDRTYHLYKFSHGYMGAASPGNISTESWNLLQRATNVFSLAYTRFSDLQKAEAQAREAQIETALERVRSRSMGMQKSGELKEVIQVVYQQFAHLNIKIEHTGFVMDYKARDDYDIWIADPLGVPSQIIIPYFDSLYYNRFNEAKEKGEDFFATNLTFEEKNKFYQKLFEYIPGLPEQSKEFYFSCPGLVASTVLLENVCLYIENFSGIPYSDEENNTLMRFGKVFQQTYTRFLDLQKAEAQAHEAQIETSLERVRARTMAMQNSNELPEAANLLFQQVQSLGMPAWSAGYCIWDEDKKAITLWMSSEGVLQPPFRAPLTEDPSFIHMREAYERGETFFVDEIGGEELKTHYKYMRTLPVVDKMLDSIIEAGHPLPTFQIFHLAYFSQGFLLFITYEPVPEAHDIFKRFGKVFDQTYTRFLDLQKAEAQAREAKIEAALERTRTQSMIMQHSSELDDALRVFHEQVLLLGINSAFSFLWLPDEDKDRHIFWAAWEEEKKGSTAFKSKAINYPLDRNEPATTQCLVDWKGNEPIVSYHVPPSGVESYFAAWQELIDGVEKLKPEYFSSGLYYVEAFMKYGCFGVMVKADLKEDEKKLLGRFAIEFERTYTRFLDLQKAEAQAREAKIEAALERVRSKAMAMHKSDDLNDAVTVVFEELDKLNLGMLRCGIGILSKEKRCADVYTTVSTENGHTLQVMGDEAMDIHPLLHNAYEAWLRNDDDYSHHMEGQEILDYYLALTTTNFHLPESQQVLSERKGYEQFTYHANFQSGSLFAFRETPFPEEAKSVMKRFANVFNLTYQRFLDIQKAEAQALEAQFQKQLIETKHREITENISYALRIQTAILPSEKIIKESLPNSFVLYLPKDVVAGDFYWMLCLENMVLFSANDYTGHGVSGAMVSVFCHSALNRAIREYNLTQPSLILDKVAELVEENFTQSEDKIQDGMDTSLCAYFPQQQKLQWAGANNPLWIVRNNELIEYKPDKQPIGKYENRKSYTNHVIELQQGDTIYIFSDGYHDQFGGERGKKLTKKGLQNILLSIQEKNMEEQYKALLNYHNEWKDKEEQVDDICLIGVRV